MPVRLGDFDTYYKVGGAGEALVLLHPGLADSRAFERSVPGLAERSPLFRPDRREHGRTPDVDGAITYAGMADDTIAFREQVVGGPAPLVGHDAGMPHSQGAELALLLLGGFHSMVDVVVDELDRRGHPGVRPVHEFALRAIDGGADTASELGRRLDVSKQAAAKTIAALQRLGYVERAPDRATRGASGSASRPAATR